MASYMVLCVANCDTYRQTLNCVPYWREREKILKDTIRYYKILKDTIRYVKIYKISLSNYCWWLLIINIIYNNIFFLSFGTFLSFFLLVCLSIVTPRGEEHAWWYHGRMLSSFWPGGSDCLLYLGGCWWQHTTISLQLFTVLIGSCVSYELTKIGGLEGRINGLIEPMRGL